MLSKLALKFFIKDPKNRTGCRSPKTSFQELLIKSVCGFVAKGLCLKIDSTLSDFQNFVESCSKLCSPHKTSELQENSSFLLLGTVKIQFCQKC